MHILIVGARHVGKSTLIGRVLAGLDRPVFGFETRKEDGLADAVNGSPVYIYDAGGPYVQCPDRLVGHCKDRHPLVYPEAFDRFAGRLCDPPPGSVVVLDEIGFMESESRPFCEAIMRLLDGDVPVIAAVKHNDTPFLQAVRRHPRCRCFAITPENRDALSGEVLAFARMQL